MKCWLFREIQLPYKKTILANSAMLFLCFGGKKGQLTDIIKLSVNSVPCS